MLNKSIPIILLLFLIPIPAFAQSEGTECIIAEPVNRVFDQIDDFAEAQTNSSDWFDQEKKDQINKVTDSGTGTGKIAFQLWCGFHHFIVDAVFAGSPVPFDHGIVVLVSFVLGIILVVKLFWEFLKKIWKIVLILIAIIAIFVIAPIDFPSIT